MDSSTITVEEFLEAAKDFIKKADQLCDGWTLVINQAVEQSHLKKSTYLEQQDETGSILLKAEYVIYFNLSYGVPAFSFNMWNGSGVLLTLNDVRKMSFITIKKEDFYSVITQQEHPIFFRPYFIMHPCHTSTLLKTLKMNSRNIIVTFLSLITPLIRLNLPLQYGL